MYELLLFTGGVYKFDEFEEFIDDIGGLIIEMESFKVSRGMYFLSEEMKVLVIAPQEENEIIREFAKKIKGNIEPVLMEDKEIKKVIIIFEIYRKLQISKSMHINDIINHLLDKPDLISIKGCISKNICNEDVFFERINDLLILMKEMSIIEKLEQNGLTYYQQKKSKSKINKK